MRSLVFVALLTLVVGVKASHSAEFGPGNRDCAPPPAGDPVGRARLLQIAPRALTFGRVTAGTTSTSRRINVFNPNKGTVTFGPVTLTGPFIQSNDCGAQIGASGRCTITVNFTSGVFSASGSSAPVRAKVPTTIENGTLTVADGVSCTPVPVRLRGVQVGTPIPTPTATATATQTATATPTTTATSTATTTPTVTTATATPSSISGFVNGGGSPISGATVTLYQAGNTGYGQGALSLGNTTTDTGGAFTVAYSPVPASSELYIVATDGDAGFGSNSVSALIATLGSAGALPTSVTIDEVTTVATTWAMAQFMDSTGATIGTSATNTIGLVNAASAVTSHNIVDLMTGLAPNTIAAGVTSPTKKLYALADILASCVESSGGAQCANLFGAATPSGGTAPTTTLQAALDIARNPSNNVAGLYGLILANAPYEPTLSSAPTDWTLALSFTGGGLSAPTALAIDASGDVWIADYNSAVSELSPIGAALSPSSGFTGGGLFESLGIAIDQMGRVWVTDEQSPHSVNSGNGAVTMLGADGSILTGANGISGGGIDFPQAVAIDASGNAWVANYAKASVTEFSAHGSVISPSSGFSGGGIGFPAALAFDASGNLWISDQSSDAISELAPNGSALSPSGGYSGGGLDGPFGIAVDQLGNVWIANYFGSDLAGLDGSSSMTPGTPFSPMAGYTGGGIDSPAGLAIDGAGNIWVTNYHAMSVSEFAGASASLPVAAISGNSGYTDSSLVSPYGIAIDPSGNVWIADNDAGDGNAVTELLGAATPVKTPLIGPAQLP